MRGAPYEFAGLMDGQPPRTRERTGGRMRRLFAPVTVVLAPVAVMLALAAPAAAGAALGELSYAECLGSDPGCVSTVAPFALVELDGVAVSPNGRSLYVASNFENVSHFVLDASGRMSFEACITSRKGGTSPCTSVPVAHDALSGARGIAVSPNGSSVYAAALTGNDVVHFFANPGDGKFSWDGCVSGDGSEGSCLDAKSGEGLINPTAIAVAPSGGAVYTAGNFGVSRLPAEPEAGRLSWGECLNDKGTGGCSDIPGGANPLFGSSVVVSPNGRSLYVGGDGPSSAEFFTDGNVSHIFANPAGGAFTWDGCVSSEGSGGFCADVPGSGKPLDGTSAVAVSPDATDVYAASSEHVVSHLRAAAEQGQLTFTDCLESGNEAGCSKALPGPAMLQGPRSIAVSPDGRSVYVAGAGTVVAFSREPGTGSLSFQQCLSEEPVLGCAQVAGGFGGEALAISPDGKSVYAVARLARNTTAPSGPSGPGGGGTPGGHSAGVTRAALRASLLAQLAPRGTKAKVASIAHRRSYSYSFRALEAGTVTVAWYSVPRGAHLSAAKRKPKPVLIASGTLTFKKAGAGTLKVRLTRAGRHLLRRRSVKLTAKGAFKPAGEAVVTALEPFTLHR